jgi:hypothetical protein
MLLIDQNTTVYISCVSIHATGGTELLHQLGQKLNKLGIKVKMFYYDYYKKNLKTSPVAERFEKYNIDYVTKIQDNPNNIIIIPEIAFFLANKFRKSQKVFWWLSVDFYTYVAENSSNLNYKKRAIKEFIHGNFKSSLDYFSTRLFNPFNPENVLNHWVQSIYAEKYLLMNGINKVDISYLSDYLNDDFIIKSTQTHQKTRNNAVLYNPLKGIEMTNKIIQSASDIEFIPLQNLTVVEMINLMQTSKVYIDFGNHPGKDRIPREAAISGAVIITNKKGSAQFYEDVPSDSMYKIDESEEFELRTIELIRDVFKNFELHNLHFDNYRDIIRQDENKFETDLKQIFQINE